VAIRQALTSFPVSRVKAGVVGVEVVGAVLAAPGQPCAVVMPGYTTIAVTAGDITTMVGRPMLAVGVSCI